MVHLNSDFGVIFRRVLCVDTVLSRNCKWCFRSDLIVPHYFIEFVISFVDFFAIFVWFWIDCFMWCCCCPVSVNMTCNAICFRICTWLFLIILVVNCGIVSVAFWFNFSCNFNIDAMLSRFQKCGSDVCSNWLYSWFHLFLSCELFVWPRTLFLVVANAFASLCKVF